MNARALALWTAVIVLPIVWMACGALLLRDRLPTVSSGLQFSDRLNVVMTILNVIAVVVALFGLYVAVGSYRYAVETGTQQLAAGDIQEQTLEAQKRALDASRQALEQVVATSEKSRAALEAQLALLRQQREEELERLRKRPRIEVALGNIEWTRLREGKPNLVDLPESGVLKADFFVKNIGDAVLEDPTILIRAQPPSVQCEPSQFSGISVQPLVPFSDSQTRYHFESNISVPSDVQEFTLLFAMIGRNLPKIQLTIPLRLNRIHKPRPAHPEE